MIEHLILDFIDQERSGETVDNSMLKNVFDILIILYTILNENKIILKDLIGNKNIIFICYYFVLYILFRCL